jgi:hypothetical protein
LPSIRRSPSSGRPIPKTTPRQRWIDFGCSRFQIEP